MNKELQFKCLRCRREIEFYYDPNQGSKKDTNVVLVKLCPCSQQTNEDRYMAGYKAGYADHQKGNFWA